jgi:hypothetical protein
MDHDVIVEPGLDRYQRMIENIVQAPDLHRVASAELTLFAQMRPVARDMLQAKIDPEAQKLKSQDVALCCQEAEGPELRVEITMEGGMAHLDGRWQAAKVGTIVGVSPRNAGSRANPRRDPCPPE